MRVNLTSVDIVYIDKNMNTIVHIDKNMNTIVHIDKNMNTVWLLFVRLEI